MTSAERQRHNAIVGGIYIKIAQVRHDIDTPGYNKLAADTLREISRLALGEAHALDPKPEVARPGGPIGLV
jgi:hypothetical protein